MEQDKKLKNLIKTIIREFLNENDSPPSIGKKILYKLTDDDYSYVPYELKYLGIHVDRTLLGKNMSYLNDEGKYQTDITNLDWFLIYYGGKRYSYDKHSKILKDKSDNKIKASEQDNVFRQQINKIIHNTLNPTKPIDVF